MANDLDLDKLYTQAAYRDTTTTFDTIRLDKAYTHAAYRKQNLTGLDADPYFGNVQLLCGFNDVDGVITFVDESLYQRAITRNGNAQIDTAQSVFGGSSLLLDGTGDYLTVPSGTGLVFGSGQFTIEGRYRFAAIDANSRGLMGKGTGSLNQICWTLTLNATGTDVFFSYSSDGGSSFNQSVTAAAVNLALNTWYAIAVDRDATNKIRIYVDGVMRGSDTPASAAINVEAAPFVIGAQNSTGTVDMNGWVDEVRVTKGVARYASDAGYTVPTKAFPRFFEVYDDPANRFKIRMADGAWTRKPAKAWTGSAWVTKPVKTWTGSAWV